MTGHMVAGIDGTAARSGRVGALSTAADQELFRRMRQIADVVLVGAETVRRERYGPVRLSEQARAARAQLGRPPIPPVAVVSRSLDLDWSAPLFTRPEARTYVVTCAGADPARIADAEAVATVVVAGDERVDPARALAALAGLGHRVVLCEGGPRWLGELVAAERLDELCLTVTPVIGGDPLPVCVNPPGNDVTPFRLHHAMIEEDGTMFLRYQHRGGQDG
ncbi:pyrimidine reductase family protein [Nocardioides albidus]|uniref:Pyrimidine reductase family protein n=1 Tax=Nocardioides albidus TaxID=1517589 RepID=A0A5C4WDT8_9ACTN|nr:pyrimidine reductase family protein [Nocardioides albidus]